MASRSNSIDVCKGLGIILVVLGHNQLAWLAGGVPFRVIFSFHMPLFFVLAGVFMNTSEPLHEYARSRVQSLLKPYFVVLLFLGLAKLIYGVLSGRLSVDHVGYFAGVLLATGSTIVWEPMWFMPHLFLAGLVALFSLKLATPFGHWAVAGVASGLYALGYASLGQLNMPSAWLSAYARLIGPTGLPWSIDLIPMTAAFILIGKIFSNRLLQIKWRPLLFLMVGGVFVVCHVFFDVSIDLNRRQFGSLAIASTQAAAGIYICLSVSELLERHQGLSRTLRAVGMASLFIMIFHTFFQFRAIELMNRLGAGPIPAYLGGWLAGVGLPIGIWALAKKFRWTRALFFAPRARGAPGSESGGQRGHVCVHTTRH